MEVYGFTLPHYTSLQFSEERETPSLERRSYYVFTELRRAISMALLANAKTNSKLPQAFCQVIKTITPSL